MEDQPTDPGDLTAADGAVPLGKSARTRHRLPRQKVRPPGDDEADSAADTATEVEAAADTATEADSAADTDTDTDTATEVEADAEIETPQEPEHEAAQEDSSTVPEATRRRLPWRRTKDVDDAPADPSSEAAADDDHEVDEPDVILVPHRPAGRALKVVAVAAGVLFVAAGAFAGAALQPYLADRAAVQTKFEIAETAAGAITTLWTYTPDDMDKLPERSAKYLGGDFETDYKRYIDAIAATNKQAQVSNDTQVLGAAVESLTANEATAIVYTNSVATSPVTKGIPSLKYLSYSLTMKRDADRWLITRMVAVTKLDLTPRL